MFKQFSLFVSLLLLFGSCKVNHLVDTDTRFYRMNERAVIETDSSVEALIAPYKAQLDAEMNTQIGTVGQEMTKGQPESTLGNWFADLLHEQTEFSTGKKIDFAVVNQGGIRIGSIPAGPINKGKIFELMPFDNMVVLVEIDGRTMEKFFHLMAENGGWPISKSVHYKIENKQAKFIYINDQPLDYRKNYTVSMSDYIANGGSDCEFLVDKPQEPLGIFLRDLILEYIEAKTAKGVMLGAKMDGRVVSNEQ